VLSSIFAKRRSVSQDAGPSSAGNSPSSPDNVPTSLDDALSPTALVCRRWRQIATALRRPVSRGDASSSLGDGLPPLELNHCPGTAACLPWRWFAVPLRCFISVGGVLPPLKPARRPSTTARLSRRWTAVSGQPSAALGGDSPPREDGPLPLEMKRCPEVATRRPWRQTAVERRRLGVRGYRTLSRDDGTVRVAGGTKKEAR
jgi:hypothetical protein